MKCNRPCRTVPFGAFRFMPFLVMMLTAMVFATPAVSTRAEATFVPAFPKLWFNKPLYLTASPDGANMIFVVEQDGRILYFPNDRDVESAQVAIDHRDSVLRANNEEGLLGFAFHPRFVENREVFLHYSARQPRRNVLSRFRMEADGYVIDTASEEVILEVRQPWGNHNGGGIEFGPDGYLYITLGDGGSANDPLNAGQDLTTMLGKILRIDIDKRSDDKAYAIPDDNPFVGHPEALPEIWAYGLRNVWRFSFDRKTGDLWAGDVGQNLWEEINLISRGGNYGWRIREGKHDFTVPASGKPDGLIDPVIEHGRSEAASITGGYVYRGEAIPGMHGAYVYADYVTGRTWAFWYSDGKVQRHIELGRLPTIASFGEDEAGELYAVSHGGGILKMVAVPDRDE